MARAAAAGATAVRSWRRGLPGLVFVLGLATLGDAVAQGAAGAATAGPVTERHCLDRFRADTARIEREFAARRRAAGPFAPAADQAWARELHAALAKAADAAEACSRAARKARP